MTFAVDWALNNKYLSIREIIRPDITVTVGWALKINYLSIYPRDTQLPLSSNMPKIYTVYSSPCPLYSNSSETDTKSVLLHLFFSHIQSRELYKVYNSSSSPLFSNSSETDTKSVLPVLHLLCSHTQFRERCKVYIVCHLLLSQADRERHKVYSS